VYATAAIYSVTVTATDDDTGSSSAGFEFDVYDPGVCVSGAASINSPVGALTDNPTVTGKANMSAFSAKYAKNATVPTGSFQFAFPDGNFVMISSSYRVLVGQTTPAKKVWVEGSGTASLNGGSYPVDFLVSAIDSSTGNDTLRVQAWKKDGTQVYDSDPGAARNAVASRVVTTGPASIMISTTCR
jgi:hypothetical protein